MAMWMTGMSPLSTIGQDQPVWNFESEVVVCVTAKNEPWRLIDKATLKRRNAEGRTYYSLNAGGRSFSWWNQLNPDGSLSGAGGASLAHYVSRYIQPPPEEFTFAPDTMPGTGKGIDPFLEPSRISMKRSGEVVHSLGPFEVATFIGTECPAK